MIHTIDAYRQKRNSADQSSARIMVVGTASQPERMVMTYE